MVSIIRRMRHLRALLAIRLGPGAAILPPEVTRIHMDFAIKQNDGHAGPRRFWRTCLPRLKYHNPAVPMTINRTADQAGPATMTIHFTTPEEAASSKPAINSTTNAQTSTGPVPESTPAARTERTETIDMKHKKDTDILAQLLTLTKARVVKPTAEETRQLQGLEEQRMRSDRDADRQRLVNLGRKKEEAIMIQARGEIEAARET